MWYEWDRNIDCALKVTSKYCLPPWNMYQKIPRSGHQCSSRHKSTYTEELCPLPGWDWWQCHCHTSVEGKQFYFAPFLSKLFNSQPAGLGPCRINPGGVQWRTGGRKCWSPPSSRGLPTCRCMNWVCWSQSNGKYLGSTVKSAKSFCAWQTWKWNVPPSSYDTAPTSKGVPTNCGEDKITRGFPRC